MIGDLALLCMLLRQPDSSNNWSIQTLMCKRRVTHLINCMNIGSMQQQQLHKPSMAAMSSHVQGSPSFILCGPQMTGVSY
jgi:hypothetical protein